MKIKIMTLIFIITIVPILIISTYEQESIITKKKNLKNPNQINEIDFYPYIYVNDENNQPLSGVTFKLKDFNNTMEEIIPEKSPGYYELVKTVNYELNDILKIMPKSERERVEKIKTTEDLEKDENSRCYSSGHCRLNLDIPFIIEQEKVPSGYIKEKYIILPFACIDYETEENNIISSELTINLYSHLHMDYKNLISKDTFVEDLNNSKYNDVINRSCPLPLRKAENENVQFSLKTDTENCALNIIQEKGTIDLSVENYVNKKLNITTTDNKKLNYNIIVKNTGTASSTNNVIITNIPKEFEYVENSASHSGKYNKEKHQIEWQIEEIEAEDNIELAYQAYVPKNANKKLDYIGTTTIHSTEVQNEVESDETIVKITEEQLKNPNTYNIANLIVFVIFGISLLASHIATSKKKIKVKIRLE